MAWISFPLINEITDWLELNIDMVRVTKPPEIFADQSSRVSDNFIPQLTGECLVLETKCPRL